MSTDDASLENVRGTSNRGVGSADNPIRLPGITVIGRLPRTAEKASVGNASGTQNRGVASAPLTAPAVVPRLADTNRLSTRRLTELDMIPLVETRSAFSSPFLLDQLDPRGERQPLPLRLERILGQPIDFSEAPSKTLSRFSNPTMREAIRASWPVRLQTGPSISADTRSPYEIEVGRARARALEAPPQNPFAELGPAASLSLLLNLVPYLAGKTTLEDVAASADAVKFIDDSLIAHWFQQSGITRVDGSITGMRDLVGGVSGETVVESRPAEVRKIRAAQEVFKNATTRDRAIREIQARQIARQTSEFNRGLIATDTGYRGDIASAVTRGTALMEGGKAKPLKIRRPPGASSGVRVAREAQWFDTPRGAILDPGYQGRLRTDPPRGQPLSKFDATSADNITRMLNGKPPVGPDGKPVELHHRTRGPLSRLDEYSSTQHDELPLHEADFDTQVDRGEFDLQRSRYWVSRVRGILLIPDSPR
jgi:HNH/ENDO VII superfamily nuclease